MISAFEKAKDFLFGYDIDDDYEEEEEFEERPIFSRRDKVVNMPNTNRQMQIMGFRPTSFSDVEEIAKELKDRKAVLIDVNNVKDDSDARRIVDFIAGVVMGIDGDMKKLTHGIFSAAPSNVALSGDFISDTSD